MHFIVPAQNCNDCGNRTVRNGHCSACGAEWPIIDNPTLPPTQICVIVTGGRDYADRKRVFEVLDKLHDEEGIACVAHGACGVALGEKHREPDWKKLQGADRWADQWAWTRGAGCTRYPADWLRRGKSAGPNRNAEMLEAETTSLPAGKELVLVCFPGGTGTANMRKLTRNAGLREVDGGVRYGTIFPAAAPEDHVHTLRDAGWAPGDIANLFNLFGAYNGSIRSIAANGMVHAVSANGTAILYPSTFRHAAVIHQLAAMHGAQLGAVEAWCDGSGTTAEAPAGAGVVIQLDSLRSGTKEKHEISVALGNGTNNFAELHAVWWALRHAPLADHALIVRTDSEWTINALTNKNWKVSSHLNVIEQIKADLALRARTTLVHVRGHNGDVNNELADRLARRAAGRSER